MKRAGCGKKKKNKRRHQMDDLELDPWNMYEVRPVVDLTKKKSTAEKSVSLAIAIKIITCLY